MTPPRTSRLLIAAVSAAVVIAAVPASASANAPVLPKTPALGSIWVSPGSFACGVTRSAEGLCWGSDGSEPGYPGPGDGRLDIPTGKKWASLSLTYGRGCGVTTAGQIFCWGGYNDKGQNDAPAGHTWLSVSVTAARTCGIDSNRAALCWGATDNGYGTNLPTVPTGKTWKSVVAHDHGACGVTLAGEGVCWTLNAFNEGVIPSLPVGATWDSISLAYTTACGVSNKGTGYCWGETNDRGQRTVPAGKVWKRIAAGSSVSCGVTRAGEGLCWGESPAVNAVPAGKKWSTIEPDDNGGTACGITTRGEGICWGRDDRGQATVPVGKFTALPIPGKPSVKWAGDKKKHTATATVTPVSGITYTLTAKLGRKTKTGKCKAKGKKVVCTLKTGKGKWAFSVTPSNVAGPGKANGKAIKL